MLIAVGITIYYDLIVKDVLRRINCTLFNYTPPQLPRDGTLLTRHAC